MLTNLIKFLDPSVKHWDDKKGATRMTKKEHWDDRRRGYSDNKKEATRMTPFTTTPLPFLAVYSY
ncbi:hypothetical protein [Wolbachia endosymbiont (group A) of Pipizella viduata]|uniref:hypothetical protein n=1 Tax=Wolbachia endosymbiont (group A) of Pipizella viduata TaxID=3066154 RepID=UPI00333F55CA